MATFTINTRKHGEVTFTCRDIGGYVRVISDYWDHKQIYDGGYFCGNPIAADEKTLEAKARKWWKAFLAAEREFGL